MAKVESTMAIDEVVKTSQLINDGENGNSKYVDENQVLDLIQDNIPTPEDGDKHYIHYQSTPSNHWIYQHGLNKKPSVQVTDSAGTVMGGQIIVNDGITVEIKFNIPFWGYATNN